MSEGVGQVVPSVEEVARLVGELVASEWPTTQGERSAWFERHGIAREGAEGVREEHGSESWHSRRISSIGSPALSTKRARSSTASLVQLHVDHVEPARRADETAARARPAVRGRDWLGDDDAPHPPTP